MGVLEDIENVVELTEQDVLKVIAALKTGAEVAISTLGKIQNWIAGNAAAIAAAVQEVEELIATLEASIPGFSQNAEVTQAIAQANAAVVALNAFATASDSGTDTAAAVVSGVAAYYGAQAAANSAKAAVVAANSNMPAPAAAAA